ncbi:MAG: CDP-diacylglycerol--glycerol-3-phosphate 3-phosphatidyltransferase [Proteobacteria bacterium]|nr:CDP-diacylglycerol--glycerol-3-phosphate 3-phosphatidyltransferase [Pseudomonadota bacterium]MBU1140027.1 CDP-diacylglycerol--glycerol-3-phosphate 3-phosphatidyltransferase [Pseudomonadota bacterium]MBU1231789.1 CDP-diacylglycerol--glycerol-3-phosphate 3-phosphatidyltransferase [Pseudomonadota bacterium]MBU1417830.1 CDP-diacylglycerol--glycerol-3-phosphate 3-phosphatidyltransferase [Pseudomonadota bacterium]MBU1456521.1 CDP-diacylglycerol--glycerol-3-phosphate 3-phosphatidyltransferase [Pseu
MKQLMTGPNLLTGLRFALIPLLVVLLSLEQSILIAFVAWFVFAFAAFTDWLDGYLARKYHSETVLGKLMDPLADKVLVTAALIMLIPLGRIPAWICLLIVSREIIITGLRGLAASAGKVVAAGQLGKIKSNFQYYGLGFLIFPLGLLPIPYQHEFGMILVYVSLVLSIWSAVEYIYNLRDIFEETP